MKLRDVLDEKIIHIGMEASDKDEALRKMAGLLADNGYIDDVEEFVGDVYLREKEGVTGIGQGIAIPHGKSKSAKKLGIAIVSLKAPIAWETLDGEPVDTVFLFCVSCDSNFERNHMLLLSKVAARLADEELLARIKGVTSAREMIGLLAGE
ncbi:MAG: PTS sugar transporter subunit IIA [Lachnospiraceae bacterium]|jgi:PTS system fructose-specific IIA component|nr:PTS sugar transporter subunit IIA [Lachnospiraceae bacterium]